MSDKPTRKGLPPVPPPHPKIQTPRLPSMRAAPNPLRGTPPLHAAPAAPALLDITPLPDAPAPSRGRWPTTTIDDAQSLLLHARRLGGGLNLQELAKGIAGCQQKKETAGRVEFLEIKASDGITYRIYDQHNNMISNEKFGKHAASFECEGRYYFVYVNSAEYPWPE
ncbi:MAG: hypothetical protein PHQ80_03830 [Candidatus ainarchaeum sp.]|nr:hypothetical protein [Candidatus ainarchaeum sp.]